MLSKLAKFFSVSLFLVLCFIVGSAYAQTTGTATVSPCTVEEDTSKGMTTYIGVNSQNTSMDDKYESGPLNAYIVTSGAHLQETMGCQEFLNSQFGLSPPAGTTACNATDEQTCKDLSNAWEAPSQTTMDKSHRAGSLLHMAYRMDNSMRDTPPYANLAYFFIRSTEKIPFVNKTLAQTTGAVNYQHTMIRTMFDLWQVTRNLALALMSIILLVIGIMIILRKRINPQVVVSVQYAIPRIVLAFILIVMSYPIGATITSVAWTLSNSSKDIIASMFSGFVGSGGLKEIGPGALINLIVITLVATAATGGLTIPGILGAIALVAVICVIAYIYVLIKIYIVYLKMLVSIVSAPVEFVVGAIPGSEDKVAAWFKRMAIYAVTLFLMRAVFWLGVHASITVVSSAYQSDSGGFLISTLVPVLILLYSIGLAVSMESKVQGFIDPQSTKKR